ncbi:DUF4446 family protein [Dermacoccaceae bacterium W4C1]
MSANSSVSVVVAVVALAVAAVAVVIAVQAARSSRSLTQRLAAAGTQDAPAAQLRLHEQVERLNAEIQVLRGRVESSRGGAGALRHVAVVRYDAFGDVGGRMSFSAALLDDEGDGLVLSSIHARGESRTYAKGVIGGGSDVTLTPEEQQALAAAREDRVDA